MNTLINTNDDVIRCQLRKVAHYWGYQEGTFIYYMFATPWVRTYVNDMSNMSLIKGKPMPRSELAS